MSNNELLEKSLPVAPIKIAALAGCRDLAEEVDKKLVKYRKDLISKKTMAVIPQGYCEKTFLIDCECIRFGTGEGKGYISDEEGYEKILPYLYPDPEQYVDAERLKRYARICDRGDAVKASLRSRGDIDVAALAKKLGGGGHKNAAGATLEGTMAEAETVLVRMIGEILK